MADLGARKYVRQNWPAVSPIAITEVGAAAATIAGIYRGNPQSVFAGFPDSGVLNFFRAGSEDIGEANTNLKRQGTFDWLFDVTHCGVKMVFPRSIVDGSDLFDIAGAAVTDNLAARKLLSRYTRIAELYLNNSRFLFQIVETKIVDAKLTWVGSGPSTVVEGLSISHGPNQFFTVGETQVDPSVGAFSVRTGGHGKKDLWKLGKVRLEELRTIIVQTSTDPGVIPEINALLTPGPLPAPLDIGGLYEDAAVGIRIKAYLYGSRVKKSNYGAV